MRKLVAAGMMAALLAAAGTPARAQIGGDSFQFIKAVKDRDVIKARELAGRPGSTIVNAKDGDNGGTGLHIVTRDRDLGWMGFLLQEGADANARDRNGATPLIIATDQHFVEGAKLLIAVKADIDATNRNGETALIRAVQGRDTTLVRLLVESGANPDKTDNVAGQSARDYAKADRRSSMIARILEEGKPASAADAIKGFSLTPKPAAAAARRRLSPRWHRVPSSPPRSRSPACACVRWCGYGGSRSSASCLRSVRLRRCSATRSRSLRRPPLWGRRRC